jgi:hypothetical protein
MKKHIWLGALLLNCAMLVLVFYSAVHKQRGVIQRKRENWHFHRSRNGWETLIQKEVPFITSMVNGRERNLWVGTEDDGVYWYNAKTEDWKQFTTTDGLGDNNAYAIACDHLGRIWIGERNHGVAVFNGETWKNYDVLEGPIGERVYRIAVCPTDGDVWLATSAGLTRYSVAKDLWRHYTRNDGLPSLQATALAFDLDGDLYVGTQCDGIAIGRASDDYRTWRVVSGRPHLPDTCSGAGLPTGLINDLLIAHDGRIYAATVGGLARSSDHGETWSFLRGGDCVLKEKNRLGGPPKDWTPANQKVMETLLPEDYVTCLAEDDAGLIWLGFRQQGFLALHPNDEKKVFGGNQEDGGLPNNYIVAILSTHDFHVNIATYGGGLIRSKEPFTMDDSKSKQTQHSPRLKTSGIIAMSLAFPSPVKPPTLIELNALLNEVSSVPAAESNGPPVTALEDDWKTLGEWQGRYGRYWIVLCANWSPSDDVWGAGWDVQYDARIGHNCASGDSLRYWVQWLFTAEPRSLEMSPTYMHSRVLKNFTTWDVDRRQSEWDDHGEAYPMSMDGPHLYCSLSVPPGLFYLSLYEFNKDGHAGVNMLRDYRVSIRPHPGLLPGNSKPGARTFNSISDFDDQPEWAHARIRDFWGGVYKRFLVRGPTKLTIEVNRNNSFNTILAGAMLDLVDELPPPYYQTRQEWDKKQIANNQRRASNESKRWSGAPFVPARTEAEASERLLDELKQVLTRNEVWWGLNKRRCYQRLLNWYLQQGRENRFQAGSIADRPTGVLPAGQEANNVSANRDAERMATCYYELGLYAKWEEARKALGLTTTREIEKSIRWDGVTYSCAGKGYEIISAYVATNSVKSHR